MYALSLIAWLAGAYLFTVGVCRLTDRIIYGRKR